MKVYKVVYYDELAEEMDDWSGELETFEEAKEIFLDCNSRGFPCYIFERVVDEYGHECWEEI